MRPILPILLLALTWSPASAQITLNPGADPQVALQATEPPGALMRPEVSSDLLTWQMLAPVPVDGDGLLRFTDSGGQNEPRRYYRAVAAPVTVPPPTGTWLVYERRTPAGTSIIYRCHLDGTSETALVVGRYPRPSYDGRWILLTRNGTGPSGHFGADIFVYDTTVVPGVNNPRLLYDNGFYNIVNYSFKHDNSRFVFDFDFDGRLRTMTTAGGISQFYFPNGDCQEAMPSFSPDDSTLAFAHRLPSQLTTRRTGEAKHPLTPTGLGDSWPQWSPDGAWIAACDGNTDFSRTDLGHDLLRVDPVTGTRTTLTQLSEPGDGFPFGGVWSSNSQWIYAAGTFGGVQGVWRVPVTGGTPLAVPITSAFDIAPGISTSPVVFVGGVVP